MTNAEIKIGDRVRVEGIEDIGTIDGVDQTAALVLFGDDLETCKAHYYTLGRLALAEGEEGSK